MGSNNNCCCLNVKTCATIVSVIGIILAVLSIVSVLFLWFYIPIAVFTVLIYIFVLFGIRLERHEYLLPATAFLAINIVFNMFILVAFIIVGSVAPADLVTAYAKETNGDLEKALLDIRIAYFVCAAITLLVTIYTIFAFIIVLKARNYFISTIPSLSHSNISEDSSPYKISTTQFPTHFNK